MNWLQNLYSKITRNHHTPAASPSEARLWSSDEAARPGFFRDHLVAGATSSFSGFSRSEDALRIGAVWACVRVLAETIASLSVGVYKSDNSDNVERAIQHSLYNILHNRPHPHYNSYTFFETLMMHACLQGNFIASIQSDGQGRVTDLQIHDSEFCHIYIKNGRKWYEVVSFDPQMNMQRQVIPDEEIIHIMAMSWDGYWGKSPVAVARESFDEAAHQQSFSTNFYKNGSAIGGIVSFDTPMKKQQLDEAAEAWREKYGGSGNSNKVAFLGHSAKFTAVSMSQKDAEFILNRKMTIEDIARIFRVPAHMINMMERATFNNIEQMSIEFVTHTIRPWVKRIETELNDKLFTLSEKRSGYYCRFNIESLLRGDTAARTQLYRDLWNIGVLSANDIRRQENMNPIDDGDIYYIPMNMRPSDAPAEADADNTQSPADAQAISSN